MPAPQPTITWPREGVPDYTFLFRCHGGPPMSPTVRRFEWSLAVDARSGGARYTYWGMEPDIPGRGAGVYSARVPDEDLAALHALAVKARLGEPVPVKKAHPGTYTTTIRLVTPTDLAQEALYNNPHPQVMGRFGALENEVVRLSAAVREHPEAVVRVGLRYAKDVGRFVVTLENPGIRPVRLADPRAYVTSPEHHLLVRVMEDVGRVPMGSLPPPTIPVAMEDPEKGKEPSPEPELVIEPGAALEFRSKVWKPAGAGKKYLAYAAWSQVSAQAEVEGMFRGRGSATSASIEVLG